MPKPLPASVLSPNKKKVSANGAATEGIILGDLVRWNPTQLPNGHVVLIGASGSGKTQSLKAIAQNKVIAWKLPTLLTISCYVS
jgi:Cdc6-like AAA superfamily ATPase